MNFHLQSKSRLCCAHETRPGCLQLKTSAYRCINDPQRNHEYDMHNQHKFNSCGFLRSYRVQTSCRPWQPHFTDVYPSINRSALNVKSGSNRNKHEVAPSPVSHLNWRSHQDHPSESGQIYSASWYNNKRQTNNNNNKSLMLQTRILFIASNPEGMWAHAKHCEFLPL